MTMKAQSVRPVRPTLSETFAKKRRIQPSEAPRRILFSAMEWWKRPVAAVLLKQSPRSLAHDMSVVNEFVSAKNWVDVDNAMETLVRRRPTPGFWRDTVGIRISGRRLMTIAGNHIVDDLPERQ